MRCAGRYGGVGYGGMNGMGFPAVDPARVEELKAMQVTRVTEQAQVSKEHIGRSTEHQCMMIDRASDQQIAMLTSQINMRREQSKASVGHQLQQQVWGVDQRNMGLTGQVEQRAIHLTASARQLDIMRGAGMGW